MLKSCSFVVLVVGTLGFPCAANAVVIDTFSPASAFVNSSPGLAIDSVVAASSIGGFRQSALDNVGSPGTFQGAVEYQPVAGTEMRAIMGNGGSTFYAMYNGNNSTTPSSNLTGLGSQNLAAGGETGFLLRSLANNAANTTIGLTLFGSGTSRTIYYTIAAASAGADYFFSFQNWAGGGVNVGNISGIILSITAPAGGNNDVSFGDAGSFASFETVVAPTGGAIVITPEPASIVTWLGLMFVGCGAVFLRRRQSAAPAAGVALAM